MKDINPKEVANDPFLKELSKRYTLPPLDVKQEKVIIKVDERAELMKALGRTGWNLKVDGSLKRARIPINAPPKKKTSSDTELDRVVDQFC